MFFSGAVPIHSIFSRCGSLNCTNAFWSHGCTSTLNFMGSKLSDVICKIERTSVPLFLEHPHVV
jgi:hypothetical protein